MCIRLFHIQQARKPRSYASLKLRLTADGHPGPGHTAFGHSGPGHTGPWTSRSSDIQVFRTSRSFGHPGPWTSKSPDVQAFRTSRSFGHPGPWTSKSPDNQAFPTSRSSDVQIIYIPKFWQNISNKICTFPKQKPSKLHTFSKC